MIVLVTANGNVRRPSSALAIQLFVNGAPFGSVVPANVTIPGARWQSRKGLGHGA